MISANLLFACQSDLVVSDAVRSFPLADPLLGDGVKPANGKRVRDPPQRVNYFRTRMEISPR